MDRIILLGAVIFAIGLGGLVGFIPQISPFSSVGSCVTQYGWYFSNGVLAGTQAGNPVWQGPNVYDSQGRAVAINGVTTGTAIGQVCYAGTTTTSQTQTAMTVTLVTTQVITTTVLGQAVTVTTTVLYPNVIPGPPAALGSNLVPFVLIIGGLFMMGFGFAKRGGRRS